MQFGRVYTMNDLLTSAALLQTFDFWASSMLVNTVLLKPQKKTFICCGKKFWIDKPWGFFLFFFSLHGTFCSHFHFLSHSWRQTLYKRAVFSASSAAVILPWTCAVKGPGYGEQWELNCFACLCLLSPPVCLGTPTPLSFSPYCLNSNARPTWRIPPPEPLLKSNAGALIRPRAHIRI